MGWALYTKILAPKNTKSTANVAWREGTCGRSHMLCRTPHPTVPPWLGLIVTLGPQSLTWREVDRAHYSSSGKDGRVLRGRDAESRKGRFSTVKGRNNNYILRMP